jgi:hypothetical protein
VWRWRPGCKQSSPDCWVAAQPRQHHGRSAAEVCMPPRLLALLRSLPATVQTQANTGPPGSAAMQLCEASTKERAMNAVVELAPTVWCQRRASTAPLREPRCTANVCISLLNFRSLSGSCTDQASRRNPATREAGSARRLQARGHPRAWLGCWASWRVLPALRSLGRLASGCCTRGVRHAVHTAEIPQRVRIGPPHHRQAVERPPTPRRRSPNSQKSSAS